MNVIRVLVWLRDRQLCGWWPGVGGLKDYTPGAHFPFGWRMRPEMFLPVVQF